MNKKELTCVFLKESRLEFDDTTVQSYMWRIWLNPISATSLRLTQDGYHFLSTDVNLKCYTVKLKTDIILTSKILLALDKYLTSPFYLSARNKIIFFGEADSMMLTLIDGDLVQYLENFS